MINYTTTPFTLRVKNRDLSGDYDVYVSIKQDRAKLHKSGTDLIISTETQEQATDTILQFTLTQEESAMFMFKKPAEIQVNWINAQNMRESTDIKQVDVLENLLDRVIRYGD